MCSDRHVLKTDSKENECMPTNTSSQSSSASANLPSTQLALRALDLGKTYQLYSTPSDRLKQILFGKKKQYFKEFNALKKISFDLPKGEVLGLVGRNGAGKSTLLQLICGTLTPSQGELQVNGRIAALLELGAGFNPQFTGRENIYLAATVMGIARQEIDKKIESIIEFSGIRPFIEQPVSTYSSGMYVRLAFSVATSVDPDILVIDEALSVGDGDFARRSFERIMSMKDAGKTILFCSHSLYQIEVLCTQAIWIEKGEVRATGLPSVVVPKYQSFLDQLGDSEEQAKAQTRESKAQAVLEEQEREANKNECVASAEDLSAESQTETDNIGEPPQEDIQVSALEGDEKKQAGVGARLTRVTGMIHSPDGSVESGKILNLESRTTDVTIDVEFQSYLTDEIPQVALAIHSAGGQLITSCGCWVDNVTPTLDKGGKGRIRIHYPNMPLFKGTYYVGVLLFCERGLFLHDEADPAVTLHVTQPNQERGVVYIPHTWQTDCAETSLKNAPKQGGLAITKHAARWHTDDANNIPQPQLFSLFERCFGHKLSTMQWRWKYQHATSPGIAVLEEDRVVAFNGGMPRAGLLFGQNSLFVQMGDVMVDPKSRGILTKKGPFYLAVQAYLEKNIGENKAYSHGFGFPNERAYLVGEKQNLYSKIDLIQEPHWPIIYEPTDCSLMDDSGIVRTTLNLDLEPFSWSLDPRENIHTNYQIDQLWQKMSASLRHLAVGGRDSRWLQYRYHSKPNNDYKLYWIKRAAQLPMATVVDVNTEPDAHSDLLGLIVVKHHPDQGVELLDFLCEKQNAESIISAAQLLAGRLAPNLTSSFDLFAWMTPSVVSWFDQSKAEIRTTSVTIPGSALDNKEHAQQIKGKWWLLGGDSDFR